MTVIEDQAKRAYLMDQKSELCHAHNIMLLTLKALNFMARDQLAPGLTERYRDVLNALEISRSMIADLEYDIGNLEEVEKDDE